MDVAIVRTKDGTVEALMSLESLEGFDPGEGVFAKDVSGVSVNVGWKLVNGAFVGAPAFPSPSLEDVKLEALLLVIEGAEQSRRKYLTPGVGQTLTYQAKTEEIRRYDADTNPIKADYPFLSAEIGVTADSLTAVADAVRAALLLWTEKGSEIERVRLKAKADILRADSPEKITGIVSSIEWP